VTSLGSRIEETKASRVCSKSLCSTRQDNTLTWLQSKRLGKEVEKPKSWLLWQPPKYIKTENFHLSRHYSCQHHHWTSSHSSRPGTACEATPGSSSSLLYSVLPHPYLVDSRGSFCHTNLRRSAAAVVFIWNFAEYVSFPPSS
jgi:hypothetical protein